MEWHDPACRSLDLISCDGVQSCMRCGSFAPQPAILPPLTGPSYIRLLRLFCGNYDEELRGEVFVEDTLSLPAYDAISYTWADESGDATLCESIYLAGQQQQQLKVTRNCKNALKRVRLQSENRLIWIDSICIDQKNIDERGHQVQLMPRIYSRACTVLAYVGEVPPFSQNFLEILAEVHTLAPVSFEAFINRIYFSRVWVLQEILLARKVTLICGDREVPWAYLLLYATGLTESTYSQPLLDLSNSWKGLAPRQLLTLLDLASSCQATDLRDKVYSVLGLAIDEHGLSADYNLTVAQCYTKTALHLASRYGWGQVLQRAGMHRPARLSLPSWVPDWNTDSTRALPPLSSAEYEFLRLTVAWPTDEPHKKCPANSVWLVDRPETPDEVAKDLPYLFIEQNEEQFTASGGKCESIYRSALKEVYCLLLKWYDNGIDSSHSVIRRARLVRSSKTTLKAARADELAAALNLTTKAQLQLILQWMIGTGTQTRPDLLDGIGRPWVELSRALDYESSGLDPAFPHEQRLSERFDAAICYEEPAPGLVGSLWHDTLALDPSRQAEFKAMGDECKNWKDMNDAVWRLMIRLLSWDEVTVEIM